MSASRESTGSLSLLQRRRCTGHAAGTQSWFGMNKLLDAITSTEALAAFLGAFAAFLLEAIRRWRSDRLAELAAGNEAVFALSQMCTMTTNINNQLFVDRIAEFTKTMGRAPSYIEFLPMHAGNTDLMRLHMDKLGFLLNTYDPDILNRIASCDRDFAVLMGVMEQRNHAHIEWQQKSSHAMAKLFTAQIEVPITQMEQLVGMDLSYRLRAFTEHLQEGLPRCAEDLKSAGEQLTKVLAMTFPTRRVASFVNIPRVESAIRAPNVKPRLWRRCVRACYRVTQTQIRWPRKSPQHS